MSMTIEEIRATRPDLAEKVERGILALKDASSAAEERNHKAAYAPRETWRPKVHEGSGLQRLTDYRPLTDFKEIRQWVRQAHLPLLPIRRNRSGSPVAEKIRRQGPHK